MSQANNQELLFIWEQFMQQLSATDIPAVSISTWFRPMKPLRIEGNLFYITVPNAFIKNFLEINPNYQNIMVSLLKNITGQTFEIIVLEEGETEITEPSIPQIHTSNGMIDKSRLNPKYTFDSFVVGKSNEFAHAASLAVAENAEAAHSNPLFIYGGVGLGKTHLMQAIGHFVLQNDSSKRVLYVTSEQFTNELINSIQKSRNEEFRAKYRNIDLLLIDDIQFIANKEMTMEEFFHTFNELHGANKQIVLTSDRPPREIKKLEDRLISRFAWGLIVDIGQPDLETRIAILRKKADMEGYDVPDDVINYIATHVESNIRELEGALSRVTAFSKLTNGKLDIETAAIALKDLYQGPKERPVTPDLIKDIIAKHFQLTVEDLNSRKRTRAIAYPRQIAMYLTRELTDLSLPKIGEEFGGRDHSTVIHAYEKIERDMEEEPALKVRISEFKKEIKGE